ncbi:glucokinase [Synechococcus sp. CBW1006]|uniref:glucokinase n=1 Tax=Synechococcus sp. CBW1006 TaxID=1353138 RepID=UPI0018CCABBC|nr:glucokinase [Synechococcus sp. CBW1006]QPN66094.1 glucokinase [Synechococcus sp. CBW1006]
MTTLLAGDIGGTKTLLALYRSTADGLECLRQQRFTSAAWPDLAPMVQAFLEGEERPDAACLAVAGPVQAGRAQLTNLPWQLSSEALARECTIPRLELENDFAVLVYGLPHLGADQQVQLHPGVPEPSAPLLIVGAGTGLGVAYGVPTSEGLQAMASEGGHGTFAPRSESEWQLKCWLQADLQLERVSIERVVSGTGLGHVARWLLAERPAAQGHPLAPVAERWQAALQGDSTEAPEDLPAATARAAAGGDALALEALDLWLGAYGSVCGDLALTGLSRGGLWLAGGTAAKLLDELGSTTFREAFLGKGRLRPQLASLPITAVVDEGIGLFSAACRARMLLH